MDDGLSPGRRRPPAKGAHLKIEATGPDGESSGGAEKPPRRALIAVSAQSTMRLCATAVEELGFSADRVDAGIGAVVAAREGKPDVIIMDLQLRDVPGREVVEWLRSNPELRSTPIIVLTSSAEAEVELNGPGVALRMPVSRTALQRALEQFPRRYPGGVDPPDL